jgi:starch phosphorylase
MRRVYDRHLGADWPAHSNESLWEAIEAIDPGELWETHQTLKSRLIQEVRRRAVQQEERRAESPAVLAQLQRALSPDTLTIGFARRFATYKRANLLLRHLEALAGLRRRTIELVQIPT